MQNLSMTHAATCQYKLIYAYRKECTSLELEGQKSLDVKNSSYFSLFFSIWCRLDKDFNNELNNVRNKFVLKATHYIRNDI
jgi:hypothetical protein